MRVVDGDTAGGRAECEWFPREGRGGRGAPFPGSDGVVRSTEGDLTGRRTLLGAGCAWAAPAIRPSPSRRRAPVSTRPSGFTRTLLKIDKAVVNSCALVRPTATVTKVPPAVSD